MLDRCRANNESLGINTNSLILTSSKPFVLDLSDSVSGFDIDG